MKSSLLIVGVLLSLSGCAKNPPPASPAPASAPRASQPAPPRRAPARVEVANHKPPAGPRTVAVPPGHYPEPGQCRLWYAGRPPGQQPGPIACDVLIGRVPRGSFVLYNSKAWDTEYDWRGHARQNPGTVPNIVLRIMAN
jgi:hypothetical protein